MRSISRNCSAQRLDDVYSMRDHSRYGQQTFALHRVSGTPATGTCAETTAVPRTPWFASSRLEQLYQTTSTSGYAPSDAASSRTIALHTQRAEDNPDCCLAQSISLASFASCNMHPYPSHLALIKPSARTRFDIGTPRAVGSRGWCGACVSQCSAPHGVLAPGER